MQTLQLRISSGKLKNKRLTAPNLPEFRAVQEIAKQAIFAILSDKITGAKVLDLFAGSGNLGLEALSRGATSCDFVDNQNEAIDAITQNIKTCQVEEQAQIIRKDAVKFATSVATQNLQYDIIFMDPYYKDTAHIYLLKQLQNLLKPTGSLVILYGEQLNLDTIIKDTDFVVNTTRQFGAGKFSILNRQKLAKS